MIIAKNQYVVDSEIVKKEFIPLLGEIYLITKQDCEKLKRSWSIECCEYHICVWNSQN